jgi:hypothetical protein
MSAARCHPNNRLLPRRAARQRHLSIVEARRAWQGCSGHRRVQLSLANQDVRGFASWHQSCSGFAHEPRRGAREHGPWRLYPIGNNGWLISTASPQYKPSFDLNREVVQKAERYGFEFALSMIKLRGFGGKSEFWDYNLESFT